MSKFIRLDTETTDTNAPFAVFTPGVAGYTDQYIASHVPGVPGSTVAAWQPAGAGATLTQVAAGAAPVVTIQEEAGRRFLRAPGGPVESRLIGPSKGTLPFTLAAVIRTTAAPASQIIGVNGAFVNRSTSLHYSGTAGTVLWSESASTEWVFALLTIDAEKNAVFRIDSEEVTSATTLTPPGSYSGIYFKPGTEGAQADILHLVYWPTALDATDRAAVHAFMKSRYSLA